MKSETVQMTQEQIKDKLINAGVNNLRDFGYVNCTKDNLFECEIYQAFFLSMLKDNKGKAGYTVDKAIDSLIAQIESKTVSTVLKKE